MIKHVTYLAFTSILVVSTALSSSRASLGPEHLIPDHEWNDRAKTWLARAMVSEAGWDGTADHIAIAFVLYRRWKLAQKSYPKYSLVAVIRRYCAGFRDVALTPRQKWVKNLQLDGTRPAHWPSDIKWGDYRDRWESVLEVAETWRRGHLDDPCGGISMYWGGPTDPPSKRMIRMNCGETKNFFYTTAPRLTSNQALTESR
jgi:hypothetical protein